MITLHKAAGVVEILDTVTAKTAHVIEQFFHFAAGCTLKHSSGSEWQIENDGNSLSVVFDSNTQVDLFEGSVEPVLGWESLGYGRKHPSPTIRTTRTSMGTCTLKTYIQMTST